MAASAEHAACYKATKHNRQEQFPPNATNTVTGHMQARQPSQRGRYINTPHVTHSKVMLQVSQTCACGRLTQWNMKLFSEHTQRHSLNYLDSIAPRCAMQQLWNAWDCCWNKAECWACGGCGGESEAGDDLRERKAPYVVTGVSKLFSLWKLNRERLYVPQVGLLNAHASRDVTAGWLVNSNRRFEGT